uniref:Uncharacterized protein n=1 Tax=Mastacembelus armatus TaxID=205130 RepID=A0A7N8YL51_9TELE
MTKAHGALKAMHARHTDAYCRHTVNSVNPRQQSYARTLPYFLLQTASDEKWPHTYLTSNINFTKGSDRER